MNTEVAPITIEELNSGKIEQFSEEKLNKVIKDRNDEIKAKLNEEKRLYEIVLNTNRKDAETLNKYLKHCLSSFEAKFADTPTASIKVADMRQYATELFVDNTRSSLDLWDKVSTVLAEMNEHGIINLNNIMDMKEPRNWDEFWNDNKNRLQQAARISFGLMKDLANQGNERAMKAFLSLNERESVLQKLQCLPEKIKDLFPESQLPFLMNHFKEWMKEGETVDKMLMRKANENHITVDEFLEMVIRSAAFRLDHRVWNITGEPINEDTNLMDFMANNSIKIEKVYGSNTIHNKYIWLSEDISIDMLSTVLGVKLLKTQDSAKVKVVPSLVPSATYQCVLQVAIAFTLKSNEILPLPGVWNSSLLKEIRLSKNLDSLNRVLDKEPNEIFAVERTVTKYQLLNPLRGAPGLFCPLIEGSKVALTGTLAIMHMDENEEEKWRSLQLFAPGLSNSNFTKPVIEDEEFLKDLEKFKEKIEDQEDGLNFIASSKLRNEEINIPESVLSWKIHSIAESLIKDKISEVLQVQYSSRKFKSFATELKILKPETGDKMKEEKLSITGMYSLDSQFVEYLKSGFPTLHSKIQDKFPELIRGASFKEIVTLSDIKEESTWKCDMKNAVMKNLVVSEDSLSVKCSYKGMKFLSSGESPTGKEAYQLTYLVSLKAVGGALTKSFLNASGVEKRREVLKAQSIKFYVLPTPGFSAMNVNTGKLEVVTVEEVEKTHNSISRSAFTKLFENYQFLSKYGSQYVFGFKEIKFEAYIFVDKLLKEDGQKYIMSNEEQMFNSSWLNLFLSTATSCHDSDVFITEDSMKFYTGSDHCSYYEMVKQEDYPNKVGTSYVWNNKSCITVSDQIGYIRNYPKEVTENKTHYIYLSEKLPYIKHLVKCPEEASPGSFRIDNRKSNAQHVEMFISNVGGKGIVPIRCYRPVYYHSKHSTLGAIRSMVGLPYQFKGIEKMEANVDIPIKIIDASYVPGKNQKVDFVDGKCVLFEKISVQFEGDQIYDMEHSCFQHLFKWIGADGETHRSKYNPTDGQIDINGVIYDIEVKCSQSKVRAITNMISIPYINCLFFGASYDCIMYSSELEQFLMTPWPINNEIKIADALLAIACAWSKLKIANAGFSHYSRNKLPIKNEYTDKVEVKSGEQPLHIQRQQELLARASNTLDQSVKDLIKNPKVYKPVSVTCLETEGEYQVWNQSVIRVPKVSTIQDIRNWNPPELDGRSLEDLPKGSKSQIKELEDLKLIASSLPYTDIDSLKLEVELMPEKSLPEDDGLRKLYVALATEIYFAARTQVGDPTSIHTKRGRNCTDRIKEYLKMKKLEFDEDDVVIYQFGKSEMLVPRTFMVQEEALWFNFLLSFFPNSESERYSFASNRMHDLPCNNVHEHKGKRFTSISVSKLDRMTVIADSTGVKKLIEMVNNGLTSATPMGNQPVEYFNRVGELGILAPETSIVRKLIDKDPDLQAALDEYNVKASSFLNGGDDFSSKRQVMMKSIWFANLHEKTRILILESLTEENVDTILHSMGKWMNKECDPVMIDTKVRELMGLEKSTAKQRSLLARNAQRVILKSKNNGCKHSTRALGPDEIIELLSKIKSDK